MERGGASTPPADASSGTGIDSAPPPRPPGRLAALADGVFAIAMTLLVLELGVPVVVEGGPDVGVLLVEMWPEFLVQHGATTVTAVAYGLNMLALFGMGWAMWTYATAQGRLAPGGLDAGLIRGGRTMGVIYVIAIIVPLLLALLFPVASMLVYATIVVAFIGFTVTGRWETVTVWRGRWRS